MKSITIDISEKVYHKVKDFLNRLPKNSIRIYDNDPDTLTAEEKKQFYSIQDKLEKGDYSEFQNWDDVKDEI